MSTWWRLIKKPWRLLSNRFSLLKVVLTVLLIFIPLYPKFPLYGVKGTYVAVRLDDFVVLGAVLIWLGWQAKHRFPILKEKIFRFFIFYWLVGLVSLLSAFLITDLVSPSLAFFHFLRRVEYMSLFFVAADAFRAFSLGEFTGIITFTAAAVFLYGMGQKYFGLPVISTMNEEFSKGILLYLDKWTRISATFAGHYDLAAWLVMILSLLPALLIKRKRLGKIGGILVGGAAFYLLILTASRISFFAYLIGITATLIFLRKFFWIPLVLGFSLFAGFHSRELNRRLVSSFRPVSLVWQQYQQRLISFLPKKQERKQPSVVVSPTPTPLVVKKEEKETISLKEGKEEVSSLATKKIIFREVRTWPTPEEVEAAAARSSQIRFRVEWPRAVRAFLKNPLLGTGFSSLGLATDSDYLRLLGETGILGFLAFFLVIFHLGKNFFLGLLRNPVLGGFLGVILGILANAVFIDIFEASKVAFFFWMLMGVGYRIQKRNGD
ncbi:hypothetical protein J7J95_00200 [bacterium]|nr:hypothetical protein [bacterium]